MPPVDNYQRIDRQNPDETSHQVNKKSVDQTRNEARIENHSTRDAIARDAIEGAGVALGKLSVGNNSNGIHTTLSLGNEAVSEYSATSDIAVNPQVTADQYDDLIVSVDISGDISNSSKKDFRYSSEQSDDQLGKVESFSSAEKNNTVENETALDSIDAIDHIRSDHSRSDHSLSDASEITSQNGFIENVGSANNSSVEGGFEMTDGAHIDSIENLTLEQAFDFLIEQTEDNYEEPVRLPLQQTT